MDNGASQNPGNSAPQFQIRGLGGASAGIKALRAGFKQGFVFELVDTTKNTPLEVHVMVLNPTKYNLSEPFQVNLTPTEANHVVEESQGHIIREVLLEGTYGIRPKKAGGFLNAQGGGDLLSGDEHFDILRRLFRTYSDLKKDPARSANIRLIFHCLRDDDHFLVSPRSFETPRDRSTRTHYRYRIQLAVLGEATSGLLQPTTADEDFSFTNALRDINEAFHDARGFFADVTANISELQGKVANIGTVLGNAAQAINAVGGLVSGASEFIDYPLNLLATVTESIANAADRLAQTQENARYGHLSEAERNLRRMEAALTRVSVYDDKFADRGGPSLDKIQAAYEGERALTHAELALSQSGPLERSGDPSASGGASNGARVRAVAGADARFAGLSIPRGRVLAEVVIRITDTLESIAHRFDTLPEVVALINDMRAPYITRGGGPGIRKPGDVILVPTVEALGRNSGRGLTGYTGPGDVLFGVDIAMVEVVTNGKAKFDLKVNTRKDDWDLRRGVENVVQGMQVIISTERGATRFIPELGIRRNVGVKGTLQHVLLTSITLREAVLSDSRITTIAKSSVELNGDVLSQNITPVLIGRRSSATFVLPFGSVSGV